MDTQRTEVLLSEQHKEQALKKAGKQGQKKQLSAALRYCIENATAFKEVEQTRKSKKP